MNPKTSLTIAYPSDLDRQIDAITHGAGRLGPKEGGRPRPGPLAFKRILVAVDDDALFEDVLGWAAALAKAFKADLRVFHAVVARELYEFYSEYGVNPNPEPLIRKHEELARVLVAKAQATLIKKGVKATVGTVSGFVSEEIRKEAERYGADLVIVGSHSRGKLGRLFLGSIADAVRNHVSASTLIVRGKAPVERIVVAADGSSHSKRAGAIAIRLGHLWGARVHLVHVFDPFLLRWVGVDERERKTLSDARLAEKDRFVTAEVHEGAPAEEIVSCAKRHDAGLIVMGARGLSRIQSLTMGSVSTRVAHTARTSVLLVRDTRSQA